MSGFAGVFHLDGAPVDRNEVEALARFLSFRGPDGSEVWTDRNAGLCHTLFRTSADTDGRAQIASLDGRLWIAGDIRLDDRQSLIDRLPAARCDLRTAGSAELVLHAYNAWSTACVERLLGDFSFVIWNARERRVFAARDHLGVKPLFYAQVGQCLVVSNTLDCVRQLPRVPADVNERAVADFLLVGQNRHAAETFFASINRLRVAHHLVAGQDGVRTARYWTLPVDEPLYLKRDEDYVERFRELLRVAVRDRLPDGPLGIFMSGGLDSPSLAVTAAQLGATVRAYTSVYDRLIPDQERHYSSLVARHLGISHFFDVRDDEPWGWQDGDMPMHTPEPTEVVPGLHAERLAMHEAASRARVYFIGDGPDAALTYEWRSHLAYLAGRRRWLRMGLDLFGHARAFKRIPLLPTLPAMWRERMSNQPEWYVPTYPAWLNADFEERLGTRQRWLDLQREPPSPHPSRKVAHASFAADSPMDWEPGNNGGCPGESPTVCLHPLWDLRLLRFLLAVPVIPWCRDKHLVRLAMKGLLPEAVRRRPKAPLAGFPYLLRTRLSSKPWLPPHRGFAEFVHTNALPAWPGENREETDHALRALGLHCWLLAA